MMENTWNYRDALPLNLLIFYSSYTIKTDRDGTMLKVGYDIMSGEYKLIAASGTSVYFRIYNDSRQTDIVDNSLINIELG